MVVFRDTQDKTETETEEEEAEEADVSSRASLVARGQHNYPPFPLLLFITPGTAAAPSHFE